MPGIPGTGRLLTVLVDRVSEERKRGEMEGGEGAAGARIEDCRRKVIRQKQGRFHEKEKKEKFFARHFWSHTQTYKANCGPENFASSSRRFGP